MANQKVVIISKGNFEDEVLKSDMPVLVDFWAPWCGPCRSVAPVIDDLAESYSGKAKICKINVDDEGELAAKFSVMSIPTIMLFKGGEVAERVIGVRQHSELQNLLDSNI